MAVERSGSEDLGSDRTRRATLRNFIRRRVADPGDAEDILQDVFYELLEAYRMMKPVEQVTAWLFRVARNRIIDLFRRKKAGGANHQARCALWRRGTSVIGRDAALAYADRMPHVSNILLQELDEALDELPAEQRDVFIAHEVMGFTFKELAEQYGVGVNTLLSRKHYAVKFLRERLREMYNEFRER